jgi:hypothetical protein
MKSLKNLTYLFIAFAFIVTASCKKYPDGPLLSLHSVKHRLAGTWDVEYFSINGYDSTSYLKSKIFYGMYYFVVSHSSNDFHYVGNSPDYSHGGLWFLNNNGKELQVAFSQPNLHSEHLGPYRSEDIVIWEIRRLTEKELWLKNTYTDGREYLVKFKLFKNEP